MSTPASPTVDGFLDYLAEQRYAVGVRERLLAHALLQQLAGRGELPDGLPARLLLLRPLLARNQDEQRRFGDLVTAFAGMAGEPERTLVDRWRTDVTSLFREGRATPRWPRLLAAAVLAALLAAGVWYATSRRPPPQPDRVTDGGPPAAVGADTVVVRPVYVPVGSFPDSALAAQSRAPSKEPVLWWMVAFAAALPLLGTITWVIHRLRLDPYLRALRTEREVSERVLYDPEPVPLAIPAARVRPVSRVLRQQVSGPREALDLPATLRATIHAGGALTARFRAVRQTPEYLVLVDRRSPHDHQATFHEMLVGALHDQGVAIDLFHFEGSPALGCWGTRRGGVHPDGRAAESFAQLSSRYGGHRLILFGDSACALDPETGTPAEWVRHAVAFPSRAWFSPLPLASWGAAEARLDALGFLVLPTEAAALDTLAEWLSSERATLAADPDWPGEFPPALRGTPAAWVARQAEPPAEAKSALLFELRSYLGALRFQWLCACAVFPALTWPLTLALGRGVLATAGGQPAPEALARGVAALGALPWFRYGRMPNWLRQALIDRMEPAFETRVRALVKERLAGAMDRRRGEPLARVAVERWLDAWRMRGTGIARDVLLAEFLEKEHAGPLAQPLPERARRFLFGAGGPLYALNQGVVPVLALFAALVACVATTIMGPPMLEAWSDRVPPIEPYAESTTYGSVNSVAFSPDGLWVVAGLSDGTVRFWRADGVSMRDVLTHSSGSVRSVAFSPEGHRLATGTTSGAVQFWRIDGSGSWRLEAGLRLGVTSGVVSLSFSPDGRNVLAALADSTMLIWGSEFRDVRRVGQNSVFYAAYTSDGRGLFAVSPTAVSLSRNLGVSFESWRARDAGDSLVHATLGAGGNELVTSDASGRIRLWRAASPLAWRVQRAPTFGLLRSADLSPGADRVVTVSYTRTQVWQLADTTAVFDLGYVGYDGDDFARFSPTGEQIVTASTGGGIRLWGRRPGIVVAIASCHASPLNDSVARAIADSLARVAPGPGRRLSPVAYGPSAWDSARLGPPPPPGEIRYSPSDTLARSAASFIVRSMSSVRLLPVPARSRPAAGRDALLPTVTVGTCGAPARPGEVRAAPASSARFLLYYKDRNDSTEARALVARLRGKGYDIRLVDVRPNAAFTEQEQIRYFYPADAGAADSIAPVVQRELEEVGVVRFTPRVANRSASSTGIPPRQIEIWLPSLQEYKSK